MNTITHRLVALYAVLIIALCSACTSPRTTSGRLLATSARTVDAAMQAWAQYVVITHPAPEQEARVRAAYEAWQSAMRVAVDAWIATAQRQDDATLAQWDIAWRSLGANEAELLNVIAYFRGRNK